MNSITVPKLADMHVHLRQAGMLQNVAEFTAAQCGMAVIMPNIEPGVFTAERALQYQEEIMGALYSNSKFHPIMTLKLRDTTTVEEIRAAHAVGIIAAKIYPAGVTTNSNDGVKDVKNLDAVFATMERLGMVLCIHGEMPGVFCLDREQAFTPTTVDIARRFPGLRVVAEHITCEHTVRVIAGKNLPNLGATITLHHLCITLDDVIGDKLKPHHFCKPVAKRPEDRNVLLSAALGDFGDKFFLGSDSAPHTRNTKECAECCAGVFTAPILGQALLEVFEKNTSNEGDLEKLFRDFACLNGPKFYDLSPSEETITYVREKWKVPSEYGNVVPFRAGEELQWKIAS